MALRILIGLTLALCAGNVSGQDKEKAKEKAKIEFRWLEDNFIKGVTQDQGIRTTCGEELSYPHAKAVLTAADLSGATLTNHGSVMGLKGDHFMVTFRFKDDAKKTLAAAAGDATKVLAVFVDGKYWGTSVYRTADADKFTSQAGFLNSKAEAERIVEAATPTN